MSVRWDVLVIDDEPVVRDVVQLVLGRQGLRVAVVGDGDAALAHPALADCRLVLCDLMLPERSGCEVVAEIRHRRPAVPIAVITGYATPENDARARSAGATHVLAKPFDDDELLQLTRHALAPAEVAGEEGRS
jgi:two-component system response regulator PilR (NtrC family)